MKLRASDWVEVRSKEEILSTLDKKGQLEGLPFMPQMLNYCGQRFQVYKRAHKTCDWVHKTWGRSLKNAVHLETRCDGEAYDGCQNLCLLFWKTAWLIPIQNKETALKRSEAYKSQPHIIPQVESSQNMMSCTEEDVRAGSRHDEPMTAGKARYICQGTQVLEFTMHLPWWDLRQYVEDYASGNVTLGKLIRGAVYSSYFNLIQCGMGLGRPLRWLYDVVQALYGGIPFPRRMGIIPAGRTTPICNLDLQPGERVRVKSYKNILETLDTNNKNRGLYFDAEAVPYCGGIYHVKSRVNRAIDEKTGEMMTFQNPNIILEDVWCQGRYSHCRMFCPRSHHMWWREIWLERVRDSAMKAKTEKKG